MTAIDERVVANGRTPFAADLADRRAEPSTRDQVAELHRRREEVLQGPSERATEQQHARRKLTVRERLELLLDQGSFVEIEGLRRHRATGFGMEQRRPATDGVVTGWGTIYGRTVFVYCHDFRIFGGSLGEAHAEKIHKIMDMARTAGAPLISLRGRANRGWAATPSTGQAQASVIMKLSTLRDHQRCLCCHHG